MKKYIKIPEEFHIALSMRFRHFKHILHRWIRWTVLPTWKYNYNMSLVANEAHICYQATIENAIEIIEKQEKELSQLNTINQQLVEKVRKYVQFFRNYGIGEEVLEMDFGSRTTGSGLSAFRIDESKNKKVRSRSTGKKEKGKNTRKAPRNRKRLYREV